MRSRDHVPALRPTFIASTAPTRSTRRWALLVLPLLAAASMATHAPAAPGDLLLRLHSGEVAPGAVLFGEGVAGVGNDLLVGAPWTGDVVPAAGKAYLFDGKSGELKHTIRAPDKERDAYFGAAVAGGKNTFAVGAPGFFNLAYTFDPITGELLQTLNAPPGELNHTFGSGLAFLDNQVLVGARAASIRDGPREICCVGAAYSYDARTGQLAVPLANPAANSGDHFGSAVATLPGKLIVGSDNARDANGDRRGRVFVFDSTSGRQLLTLENPLPKYGRGWDPSNIGGSLATLDDGIIAGAPLAQFGELPRGGVVHLFDADDGRLRMTIPNPDPHESDEFGKSVAAVGGSILVGEPWNDVDGVTNAGSVHLFDGKTGELLLTINNPDRRSSAFGIKVAAMGDKIVVGAPLDLVDPDFSGSGTVYVFEGLGNLLIGDADGDGVVDIDDLNQVRNHFGSVGPDDGSMPGDTFPHDGLVSIDDLNRVRNHFGAHRATPVPEPATLFLLIAGALLSACSFRRRAR